MVRGLSRHEPGSERPCSIAVVGTGIAGLTAAYLLSSKHSIDAIYEAAPRAGMDSQSISVGGDKRNSPRVDVPIRSFSPHYYPNLLGLYKHLGIKLQPVSYCQSMTQLGGGTIFGYSNLSIGGLKVPVANIFKRGNWDIVTGFLSFQWSCWRQRGNEKLSKVTFEQFVSSNGFNKRFYESFLLPICSSMLSCHINTVREYPANILVDFFGSRHTTLLAGWLRVEDGTQKVCNRLLEPIPVANQHFGTRVTRLEYTDDGRVLVIADDGSRRHFDHVIVATEAAHVVNMLNGHHKDEVELLRSFKYEPSIAYVHTDKALMPSERTKWRTMNSFLPPLGQDNVETAPDGSTRRRLPEHYSMSSVTVWMNQLIDVPSSLGDLFQTWNPYIEPASEHVLSKASFQRAVHTLNSMEALRRMPDIQGARKIWYCGSYASPGMTLLEQAVESAVDVAAAFGCSPPWATEPTSSAMATIGKALLLALVIISALSISFHTPGL